MTDLSNEAPRDLVILARIVSACTLGLWAFAVGLLIGVFLFYVIEKPAKSCALLEKQIGTAQHQDRHPDQR